MKLTLDFECAGGKALQPIGENHWRLETKGDSFGYNRYFCVRVTSEKGEPPATLRLEVHPDGEIGEKSNFITHFPCSIWYDTRNWTRWVPLRHTWEDSVTVLENAVDMRVPIAPGTTMHIASNPPLRYSDLLKWLEATQAGHPGRIEVSRIGQSVEGRDIPVVRLRREGKPRFFILAGQHAGEHSGSWGCEGIVEYLLSSIAEAREMAEAFDWAIVPMLNPDGNVHGWSGATAEDAMRAATGKPPLNPSMDFKGAAQGREPEYQESRLLWTWLCREFPPDAMLHFHGYMGWRTNGVAPGDGIYSLADLEKRFPDASRRAAYRAILNRLLFETPGHTAHFRTTGGLFEDLIEYQLAEKFGTLGVLYEINVSAGLSEQFQRGPQVLGAAVRALMRDVPFT